MVVLLVVMLLRGLVVILPHIASGDATQRASGDTPHIASGDATQRAKMTAEEVAEWLAMEGIEKEDVKIIKGN